MTVVAVGIFYFLLSFDYLLITPPIGRFLVGLNQAFLRSTSRLPEMMGWAASTSQIICFRPVTSTVPLRAHR